MARLALDRVATFLRAMTVRLETGRRRGVAACPPPIDRSPEYQAGLDRNRAIGKCGADAITCRSWIALVQKRKARAAFVNEHGKSVLAELQATVSAWPLKSGETDSAPIRYVATYSMSLSVNGNTGLRAPSLWNGQFALAGNAQRRRSLNRPAGFCF
jgi:hypothetical protein